MPADNLSVRQRFSEILEASRTQDRSKQSATMVVLSHLQQMTLLMIKKDSFSTVSRIPIKLVQNL